MNWDCTEDNWAQFKGNVNERWDNLTDTQLADRVQETYGMTNRDDDAQRDLTDWQQRLGEIERADRAAERTARLAQRAEERRH
jgi:uncharacterized protein YjbJ (UPF0337 family)